MLLQRNGRLKSKKKLEAIEEVSRRWEEREIEDTTRNKTSRLFLL